MKTVTVTINEDALSLLILLRDAGIFLPADCGGGGCCGKCRIRFLKDAPDPSNKDLLLLGKDELDAGVRLACTAYVKGHISLEIEDYPGEN